MPTYEIPESVWNRLTNDFTYHAPSGDQAARYGFIRAAGRVFAEVVCSNCPDSRERSVALTNIDQAVFFANAAIARNEKE